ncbi:DUF998 domain-containing protein [Streptosporangium sp. NBC_01495]|uniref:DUF998 domain-containing protein n=1 Tax=Streptosporangium sp. NBC_01495 TaxID=2903899 RepID=UPI002E32B965|nr:DUF998 domain-containing protein [Streptosporangium sp. NBC_01495]
MTAIQPGPAAASTTGSNSGSVTPTTRVLLACSVAAAPLFAIVSLAQAFTREGFDLTRHPLSMLSTGDLGWLQIANFLLSGALTVAGALGLRRVLRGTPGGTWAPRLILVNGVATAAAGVLVMDAGDGFPVGTPLGQPSTMSWHGVMHMVTGSIAFTALIAACFILGRHFSRAGRPGFATASRLSGLVFALGDGWAMSGGHAGSLTLAVGAITAMVWVSVVAADKWAALG